MTNPSELRVFIQARKNILQVARICDVAAGFGDLKNQIKRSAISVASNIAEGAGSSSRTQFIKFLKIARASNHELHAQLEIINDLNPKAGNYETLKSITYTGKMLTKLIKYLNTD